ncbi:MAG: FecR domain-containing protein [Acidobacteriota bacterium]|nr:FecR domain-containing protein [Acidobacteriota bacterium]
MNLENMDNELEKAVNQIRDEAIGDDAVEAAAARVWANLAAQIHAPLRTCSDFQALIPDFKAGRLQESRTLLVKDHLHECVACRRVYEGKVVALPVAAARKARPVMRWAIAAAVFATAGISVWVLYQQNGGGTGRAVVQAVNGTLYEILPTGITVLAAGQELPDGVEIRTAKDSDAMVQLKDGSVVEMRERSELAANSGAADLTIRLGRGSIIVQAAKRRSGHLYVATDDCRVAVTGTVFSVTNGVKGSRVSVVAGEVHVTHDNTEKVLHPGDQAVTGTYLEPVSVKDDISWSRNSDKLIQQLESLRKGLAEIRMPELRYSSRLMSRLPATTAFFASVPNLGEYLGQTQEVFQKKLSESPELRAWWAGHGRDAAPLIEKLRAASEYLGDETVVAGFRGSDTAPHSVVLLSEQRREGFAEFLRQQHVPVTVEVRNGLTVFGPDAAAVKALAATLDSPSGGFVGTPFYARIEESYRHGAGLLVAADLGALRPNAAPGGARYFIGEEKQVSGQMEARASIGFDGPRTGIASWLSAPAPMGSLDYVSGDATVVTGFVVKNPAVILDEMKALQGITKVDPTQAIGLDLRNDLAAALGGEFSVSLDGPALPVPSWKLVIETYNPVKVQAAIQKMVSLYNQETIKKGNLPVKTAEEQFEGRTYYSLVGSGGPLTEVHYTFSGGYLIAGPTRALVARSLQVKSAGNSITHSAAFLAMVPRDRYANFSAVIYQNLGTTLAPIVGLLQGMAPVAPRGQPNALTALGDMKSTLIAAYGEPDRISVATSGNLMGIDPGTLLTGGLTGAIPLTHMMGTPGRVPAFK